MTKKEVLALLKENKDERGIKIMERSGVKSFGLGLTKLKALAKKIGRDNDLALELWDEPYYDTQILATLIADPKAANRHQLEKWAISAGGWIITHSMCTNMMPEVPFLIDITEEWLQSPNDALRRCGYLSLAEIAKQNDVLPDEYYHPYLEIIERKLQSEENFVKDAMNIALVTIGSHSKSLNRRALAVAEKLGKVEVDYGDNSCEALDAVKHLTTPKLIEKLGVII